MITLSLLMITSLTAFKQSTTTANPPKWVKLGSRMVSKLTDHDEIHVTAARGTFRKLKLKVTQSPIYVTNVRVFYANGSSENHPINQRIEKGRTSRVLDLNGKSRIIKKIVFNYRTKLLAHGKAKVTVLARR